MANETVYSGYQVVAAYLDTAIAPYFRSANIMSNLCHIVNFKSKSDSIKLRKAGSVTATAGTEATDHTISQYSETSPATLTAAEVKVYLEISDKALNFAEADLQELAKECANAISQKLDTDALALLDSLHGGTQVGTSGADCSPAILLSAGYTVRAAAVPGPYVYVLNPVQIYDTQGAIITTTAAAWTNAMSMDLLNGQPPAMNGLAGSFMNIPVFETTNTESVNTNADWAGGLFSPQYALALGVFGQIKTEIGRNIKKGVTELGVTLWYDVKEYQDAAGVSIETGK